MANISPNGELNNDLVLRALLQLPNIPDADCGLSPAEIVFGHPLRDVFSFINRLVKFSNHIIYPESGGKLGKPRRTLYASVRGETMLCCIS